MTETIVDTGKSKGVYPRKGQTMSEAKEVPKDDYGLYKQFVRDIVREELAEIEKERTGQSEQGNSEIAKRIKKYEH